MTKDIEVKYEIPQTEGAEIEMDGEELVVSGEKGTNRRAFLHPKLELALDNDRVTIKAVGPNRKIRGLMGTWEAHIRNMMKGVTDGFQYKMKIVYSHFPMKAMVKGEEFVVENFMGEKHPRTTKILGDTKVQVKGDTVELDGPNKEHVGQTMANIEQLTMIKGYDPRVFQDGIYLVEKP